MDFFRICIFPRKKNKTIQRLENHSWKMWMKVVSVYDGDTITVICIFRGKMVRWRCRLIGYDAPEMKSKVSEEKEKAIKAKEFLETMLPKYVFKGQCRGTDKYGRLLLDLKYKKLSISTIMVNHKLGQPYNGGTKKAWI